MSTKHLIRWGGGAASLTAGLLFGATLVSLSPLKTIRRSPEPAHESNGFSLTTPAVSTALAEDSDDFSVNLAAILNEPSSENRLELMTGLIDRWLVRGPEEAFSALLGLPGFPDRDFLLHRLVSGWAKIDAEEVFSRLQAIDDYRVRRDLRVAAFAGLQGVDSAAVVRWFESLPAGLLSIHYRGFFSDWIEADLETAKQSVAMLRNPEGQEWAARIVAKAMAIEDPAAALAWAEELAQEPARSTAMTTALTVMAWNSPAAALEGLEPMPAGTRRTQATRAVLEHWGQRDPAAALDWANENAGDEVLGSMAQRLLLALAERDPQAAITFLEILPSNAGREMTLAQVIGTAASADPESTANWVERLFGADRSVAISALVGAWASFDPPEAAKYAGQLGEDEQFWPSVDRLTFHWMRVDPEAALRWAESLPAQEKVEALEGAVRAWAKSDPARAADYVAAQGDPAFQRAAAEPIVTEWGRWQPAEAAAWVQTAFDDPEIRGPSYEALATMWLSAYPRDAGAWIDTLPQGSDRDAAVTVLLENLASADPETGTAWADTLFDPALRESWKTRLESDD